MQIFGITLNRYSIPIIYLACSIVGFLLIRESIHMFQHPIATRAISIYLGVGFIALSLPALWSSNISIPPKAVTLLVIWLGWTLASTLLGNQPWPAMMRWFEILVSIGIALSLYFIINQQPKLINLIAKAIIAAVLLCIMSLIVYWNVSPEPTKHYWVTRLPFFMNIRHLGYLAAIAIPTGYYFLSEHSRNNTNQNNTIIWIFSYLVICWALLFWLGGRGAFLSVSVATIIYFFIIKKHLGLLLLSPLIGVIISLFFTVDHPGMNLIRFMGQENTSINTVSSSRVDIYIDSIRYWYQQHLAMGTGADGFRYITPAIGSDSMMHPHNIFIQLLLSYGPIGLLVPCYLFFTLSFRVIKIKTNTSGARAKTWYLLLLTTLVLAIFDGILYHAYGLFISSIIAGCCIALAWPIKDIGTNNTYYLPESAQDFDNQGNSSHRFLSSMVYILTFSLLTSLLYCLVFTYQLHHSKYGVKNEEWINWNARYPLYFSPTWTYQRYKPKDIEHLKKIYIEHLHKVDNP